MRFRALLWRPEAVDMIAHVIDCATLRELLGGCPGVWWAAVPKGASVRPSPGKIWAVRRRRWGAGSDAHPGSIALRGDAGLNDEVPFSPASPELLFGSAFFRVPACLPAGVLVVGDGLLQPSQFPRGVALCERD